MRKFPVIPDFDAETARLTRQIPRGRVSTYGDIADALGDRIASRYVGQFMLHHDHATDCPCHRVVRANGDIGHYITSSVEEKVALLRKESIPVVNGRVDLHDWRWRAFHAEQPLAELRGYQEQIQTRLRLDADDSLSIEEVGGVDVSFVPRSNRAVGVLVVVSVRTGELLRHVTHRASVTFPYISGYLAFRELPLLLGLVDKARQEIALPPVTLVDGSGILHPRRSGIASMLGCAANIVTIGVTKKHLWGSVDREGMLSYAPRPILVDDRVQGFALLPPTRSRKPLYISPGHGIDAEQARDVVQRVMGTRRLPIPIYWADRLSREAARSATAVHDHTT